MREIRLNGRYVLAATALVLLIPIGLRALPALVATERPAIPADVGVSPELAARLPRPGPSVASVDAAAGAASARGGAAARGRRAAAARGGTGGKAAARPGVRRRRRAPSPAGVAAGTEADRRPATEAASVPAQPSPGPPVTASPPEAPGSGSASPPGAAAADPSPAPIDPPPSPTDPARARPDPDPARPDPAVRPNPARVRLHARQPAAPRARYPADGSEEFAPR